MAYRENYSCTRRMSTACYTALLASCGVMFLCAAGWGILYGFEGKSVIPLRISIRPELHTEFRTVPEPVEEILYQDPDQQVLEALRVLDGPAGQLAPEDTTKWQVVHMKVTAYCSCKICCGKHSDGVTANRHRIRQGDVFVAADKKIPFGTEMIIPGYNSDRPVEVMDRGRLIKGNRLDVFFNSHSKAKKWGTKGLDVLVRVK